MNYHARWFVNFNGMDTMLELLNIDFMHRVLFLAGGIGEDKRGAVEYYALISIM